MVTEETGGVGGVGKGSAASVGEEVMDDRLFSGVERRGRPGSVS